MCWLYLDEQGVTSTLSCVTRQPVSWVSLPAGESSGPAEQLWVCFSGAVVLQKLGWALP